MIYKFRAILDNEEDIFRDIAIDENDTLEDFHNTLVNAFGFDGSEAASFYTCDETWNQEDEISLFDTGDTPGEMKVMADFPLNSLLSEEQTKIIYVYDFMNMWTFLIELAAIEEPEAGLTYPEVLFSHGEVPASNENFAFDEDFDMDFEEDEFDEDEFDMYNDDEFSGGSEDYGYEDYY